MSRAQLPRLCANAADVCTQKILVASKAAGLDLKLEAAKGAVPELHKGDKVVRYTNAILRYVGRVFENTDLYGSTFIENGQVDAWLDWSELELSHAKPPRLAEAVEALERHLDSRVFLVGQRFTLADASISCSIYNFQQQGLVSALPVATKRWLGACTATPAFQSVFKGAGGGAAAAPRAASPPARGSPAAAAPAAAAAVSAGGYQAVGGLAPVENNLVASYSSFVGGRTRVVQILSTPDKGVGLIGQKLSVCGWVRTKREAAKGKIVFVSINDGSCVGSLQVVIDSEAKGFDDLKLVNTGASMRCTGEIVASGGKGQAVEMLIKSAEHESHVFGGVDAKEYPLSKKEHSNEFLREKAHLRPRTNYIACVARVRSALAVATHEFFRTKGFQYVHTPLITAADCEGAGEMFQVTTLIQEAEKDPKTVGKLPLGKDGKVDYTKDFFCKPSFMTVSGQLSVENYCCALSNVYTFGPTFRAENSHTSRHLAEFWMIEPELAFADIKDDMDCAEDYLKYCVRYAYEHNREDLEWFSENVEKGLIERLENLLATPFARITYTEAIEILIKESPKANFGVVVEWGIDLGSEHERYLCEKIFMKPTIVYNYPKDIKAFYMRLNEDCEVGRETVAAMDCLCPQIGEVIGGSQREERLDVLDRRIQDVGLEPADYWWYRDLRKFGTVPHSGFGLGFERLIMLTTGVENIRDVIPYPRYPGHAEF